MKNRNALGLSRPLMTETFKIYWYLPVLTFLFYFAIGMLPFLLTPNPYGDSDNYFRQGYLASCLQNSNGFLVLILFVPVILSITMMSFMHKPTRAVALHAQPFSRGRIFCSYMLTGWLMGVLPVLAMGLCYGLLSVTDPVVFESVLTDMGVSSAVPAILLWVFASISIFTFFYGVYGVAGSLTGNSIMHLLLSGVLFIIMPLIVWITMCFCQGFLEGYVPADFVEDLFMNCNPVLNIVANWNNTLPVPVLILYLVIGLVALGLAGLAYMRAKLERVGGSMMYRLFEEIITWLLAFVGMSAFGYFFYAFANDTSAGHPYLLLGMVLGTLLTFVIVKIVLSRSIHIITKANLKSLVLYALIAALFTGVTVYDMTGYSDRIPKESQIEAISRQGLVSDTFYVIDNPRDIKFPWNEPDADELTSPEAIEKMLELHQYIVDHDLHIDSGSLITEDMTSVYLHLDYRLKSGRYFRRYFNIWADSTVKGMLDDLYQCDEVKQKGDVFTYMPADTVGRAEVDFYDYSDTALVEPIYGDGYTCYGGGQTLLELGSDPAAVKELCAALEQDLWERRTYSLHETAPSFEQFALDVSLTGEVEDASGVQGAAPVTVSMSIYPQDTHTLAFLADYIETHVDNPALAASLLARFDAEVDR